MLITSVPSNLGVNLSPIIKLRNANCSRKTSWSQLNHCSKLHSSFGSEPTNITVIPKQKFKMITPSPPRLSSFFSQEKNVNTFSHFLSHRNLKMVSRTPKRTPPKSIKDRSTRRKDRSTRRRRLKKRSSPIASALISSINKTIFTCKRRLAKIFTKLVRISTPTPTRSRYRGYKRISDTQIEALVEKKETDPEIGKEGICRVLCFDDQKLPPLISPTKKTIFLDLDETLVHSKADPPPQMFDFVVRPKIDGETMNFYVLKRPGVDEFLQALGAKFEVVVFTAGLKEYTSLVLDKLDVNGVIAHRLYRDSCRQIDGKFVKDLSEMGRDLKRVVIVDDNPNCYIFQPENAIPMKPFTDDLGDVELKKLVRFFERCESFEDMRFAVKHFLRDEGIVKV